MNAYAKNLLNAVQGKPSEGFSETSTLPVGTSNGGGLQVGGIGAIFMFVLGLLPAVLFAYGAAKLSWCLNNSYGWSFLCFLFPGFYYPYYALFLNPLCGVGQVGGRRR